MADSSGCKVSNGDITLTISETVDATDKCPSAEGTEFSISKTSKLDANKDAVIPKIVIESCPEVKTETEDKNESNLVTLRRKKTSFSQAVETISNDDYKYFEYLQVPSTGTSRKKIEIGSEKMISNNVSFYLLT